MPTLNEVVDAYVKCGNKVGFMCAEIILLKYLPKRAPDGKCYDVPAKKRPAFLRDLQNAAEHGVQWTDGGLVILDGGSQSAAISH
jgi:hypothetical protein